MYRYGWNNAARLSGSPFLCFVCLLPACLHLFLQLERNQSSVRDGSPGLGLWKLLSSASLPPSQQQQPCFSQLASLFGHLLLWNWSKYGENKRPLFICRGPLCSSWIVDASCLWGCSPTSRSSDVSCLLTSRRSQSSFGSHPWWQKNAVDVCGYWEENCEGQREDSIHWEGQSLDKDKTREEPQWKETRGGSVNNHNRTTKRSSRRKQETRQKWQHKYPTGTLTPEKQEK